MAGDEQGEEAARHLGRMLQGIDYRRNAEPQPGLAQIAEPSAQPVGLARGEAGDGDQPVECVVFRRAVEHRGDRALDIAGARHDWRRLASRRQPQEKIVDRP